jgi:putative hemolysin
VHGTAHLEEVNELLGIDLPVSDDFDTIGGLVVDQIGRIPKTGESIVSNNVRIAVTEASRRRVHRLRVEVLEKKDESLVNS